MIVHHRRLLALTAASVLTGSLALHAAQSTPPASPTQAAAPPTAATTPQAATLARGGYIVEHVAQCWRCHSPVDASGRRDRTQWLMGAPVDMRPTRKGVEWALYAPRIAGSPAGTPDQFIRVLMTGVKRNGEMVREPMPQFHLTREDAEAVLAYIRTLGRGGPR